VLHEKICKGSTVRGASSVLVFGISCWC
jgi:hypothetical protein